MSYSSLTRGFWRSIFCLCFILFCISSCRSVQQISSLESSEDNETAVEQRIQRIQDGLLPPVIVEGEPLQKTKLVDRMAALNVPGVSVAVIRNGKIEWARGFGFTKIGGPPVMPDTLFQAGSISKPVSAMAALRLVESGNIDLDVDVNEYLKSWKIPPNQFTEQSTVTMRRLLSHTAGMTVHGFPGYTPDDLMPDLVQILNGEKPANTPPILVDTMPGEIWRYAGGGYEVMQLALQDVTAKLFPNLMQETVLGPIGMTHSTFEQPLPDERLEEAAVPYQAGGQPVFGGAHIYPEMAAAGLWTTPSDLARFAIDIQDTLSGKSERVLSTEMARRIVTPVLNNYGLGLMVGGSKTNPYFTHGGGNFGFVSNMVAYNNGDGAVVMTNSGTGGQLINDIIRTIAYEYGWPDFQPAMRKEITVSPDILKQYVGTYQLAPNFKLMITLEGDQLMSQASGQGKVPVFAMSETKFFPKVVDAQIEFFKNAKDDITYLVLNQNGREMKAPRISDTVVIPKEITVAPTILKQYVGTYQLAPNFNLMFTLEGGQLIAQASGQGKAPLFAISETKFFTKVVNAQIEFFKDEKGDITHLVLYQSGSETKAPRISETVDVRKEISLSPEILTQYVGAYELPPGVNVIITLENDHLFSQVTGQPAFQLFAESETKFFFKAVNEIIEFIKDDKGAVTHLMLYQGPNRIKASRK